MRVLVCGDRHWNNTESIKARLEKLPRSATIMHGGARGADSQAEEIATKLGFGLVIAYEAEWERYGRAAGPIRNVKMLETGPDLVIAFHEDLLRSRGTAHTIREAKRRGIPVEIITG